MAAMDVPSPCIHVCRLDRASRLCVGCLRSGNEIAAWPTLGPEARLALLARLEERRAGRPADVGV